MYGPSIFGFCISYEMRFSGEWMLNYPINATGLCFPISTLRDESCRSLRITVYGDMDGRHIT